MVDNINIKTNKELSQAIDQAIKESGYKKMYIANQLGMAGQNLKRFIQKDNLSIDNTNKILNVIGYEAIVKISKKD